MGKKRPKMPENPQKIQKNQHDNSIKIIVLIWSECKERSDGIESLRASKTSRSESEVA